MNGETITINKYLEKMNDLRKRFENFNKVKSNSKKSSKNSGLISKSIDREFKIMYETYRKYKDMLTSQQFSTLEHDAQQWIHDLGGELSKMARFGHNAQFINI